ncbi:glycoside hydrolase family 2 protein [Flavisolibacter nicotianae]|uniref:glycoside hydrolase family 2 protein n=1 Tax=Flavisolibacter nicotianae TaxID=2364882 RepID=UPI001968B545|nr:sugar-binding domain-containing protein [Flavisolibacter nicotianae]
MQKVIVLLFGMIALGAQSQTWKPASVSLTTRWGKEVTPSNAWTEYPRPQLQRASWMNLNGLWNYAVQPKGQAIPASYEGQLLVPFCIESSLSGVGKPLLPSQDLWYNRTFTLPAAWTGKDVLLHFDAVDWETKLWVNGKKVGEHKGGSDPFSFNITPYLKKKGEQEIVLSVWDPTDTGLQPRGKQVLDPKGIWYTAVSGIWQTVWLEPVPKTTVQQFVPTADIEGGKIRFATTASGLTGNEQLHLVIKSRGKTVKDTTAAFQPNLAVSLPSVNLWTPQTPNLYTVDVELRRNNQVLDRFNSYFAMRKIALGKDKNGYTRLLLNNQPLFQFGTLDQGWWPDGLLTPPSDEAMVYDMVKLKEMGFNMLRKHIKVEPSRYYYHADSLGILLWQDMPSGFAGFNTPSHVAAEAREDWKRPAESATQFETEWRAIMDHLRFFPSIVMWVPLNEGWGQYDTKRIAELTKNYDPTRLVDAPSGWTDRGVGDVNDAHQYPGPGMEPPAANPGRAIVLGEFGGLGLVVKDHIWDPKKRNWGYKTYLEKDKLVSEYTELLYNLQLMVPRGLAAAIYTQTTDVEGEVNGMLTYDREVIKIPEALLRQLHASLYAQPNGKITFINKATETEPNKFKYVIGAAPDGWLQQAMPASFKETESKPLLAKGASIYAYQDFTINEMPEGLGVKLYGFGDAKIYLNGRLIWEEEKIRTKRHYDDINLSNKISLLKKGNNRLAVECTNATQETHFDFCLYRLDK